MVGTPFAPAPGRKVGPKSVRPFIEPLSSMSKRGLHQRRLLGGMAFGKAGRGRGACTASRIFRPVRPLSRALLRNSLFKTFLDQRIDEEPGAVVDRKSTRLNSSH